MLMPIYSTDFFFAFIHRRVELVCFLFLIFCVLQSIEKHLLLFADGSCIFLGFYLFCTKEQQK